MRSLDDRAFLVLVALVSLAFAWVLWPLYGALLWGTVAAIVFVPLYRRLVGRLRQRPTLAALETLLIIVLIVILPLAALSAALVQEAAGLYGMIQSGQLDFGLYFNQVADALPLWTQDLLNRLGIADLNAVLKKLALGLRSSSEYLATQVLSIGQSSIQFVVNLCVMLYLLFFLLRDGDFLFDRIGKSIPIRLEQQEALFAKFATVVRATVKGDVLVAMLQGALGGLIFWALGIHAPLLWGVLMAFLSLLPAVGAALVWLPVAIYLLAIGAFWKGLGLILFGSLVISLVDNLVRPALIGKDTKMPDYVVLRSTIGGIQMFGLNGFVVGPVIAAMFIAVWDIFAESRR